MIGGGQMSDKMQEYSEANANDKDAMAGFRVVKQWLEEKEDEREMDRS
jgi:hypothetical protein